MTGWTISDTRNMIEFIECLNTMSSDIENTFGELIDISAHGRYGTYTKTVSSIQARPWVRYGKARIYLSRVNEDGSKTGIGYVDFSNGYINIVCDDDGIAKNKLKSLIEEHITLFDRRDED